MFRPGQKALYPLLFALLIFFYVGTAGLGGKLIFGSDTLSIFYFSRSFAYSSLRAGSLPLWNPYICSGMPFLAQPQSAFFYPPNAVFFFMDICRGLNASVLLHLFLAWLFMYLLALRMKMEPLPAAVSGCAFSLSGFFIPRILGGHIPILSAAAWLPAVFLAFDGCLREKRRLPWTLLTGILLAFQILAGHPQFVAYTIIVLALYLVYCLARRETGAARVGAAFCCLLLAAGLAAIQLLPSMELLPRSIRSKPLTYREATLVSLPPENLVTVAVPGFFGGTDMIDAVPLLRGERFKAAAADQYWGRGIYWEMCPYVGIVPLMLALLAVGGLWRRNRLVPFLALLALLALLTSLGKHTPLYRALFAAVPGFRTYECPSRALSVFAFAMSLLAGFGIGRVLDFERRAPRYGLAAAVVAIAAGALVLTLALGGAWPSVLRTCLFSGDRLTYLPPAQDELFRKTTFEHARSGILLAAFWFSIGSVLISGATSKRMRGPLLVAVIAADLVVFGWKYSFGVRAQDYLWTDVEAAALREAVGAGRMLDSTDLVSLNEGMLRRIPNVCGHDPMILKRYNEFINLCRGAPLNRFTKILGADGLRRDRKGLFDLLGVSAVVLSPEARAEGMVPLEHPGPGGDTVYGNEGAMPVAVFPEETIVAGSASRVLAELSFPGFDPLRTLLLEEEVPLPPPPPDAEGGAPPTATVTRSGDNELVVEVSADRDRLMLLSEIYYPGWRAAVDGTETPVHRADYILRAVRVPPGDHTVRLWFDPPSLKKGAAISLITCLAALLLVLLAARRK